MNRTCENVINVGVAGSIETDTGQRTPTLVEQIESMGSFNVRAIYNEDLGVAKSILNKANLLSKFVKSLNRNKNEDSKTEKVYTDNLEEFLNIKDIDVVIVSEINTETATKVIINCIIKGKSVINLNAISEVTLGLLFKNLANNNYTIYSVGAGDEPASTLELIDFCKMLGLDIICAGKGKNNPLNKYSTPDDFKGEVNKNNNSDKDIKVSPEGITSFIDGTKTMLEMAILSNATGFPIDKAGMHGQEINLADLVKIFNLKENGGILSRIPVIDYVIGDVAPGVFVVFTSKQKSIISELKYLKMGKGPNFILYKPYHLGNIEVPLSIYDVVLKRKPTIAVKDRIVTTVVARAKKDLKTGDFIDSIGGYTFSGLAINYKEMKEKNYVPIGLVEKSRVKKDIKRDEIISFGNIECNFNSIIYNLWKLQTELF